MKNFMNKQDLLKIIDRAIGIFKRSSTKEYLYGLDFIYSKESVEIIYFVNDKIPCDEFVAYILDSNEFDADELNEYYFICLCLFLITVKLIDNKFNKYSEEYRCNYDYVDIDNNSMHLLSSYEGTKTIGGTIHSMQYERLFTREEYKNVMLKQAETLWGTSRIRMFRMTEAKLRMFYMKLAELRREFNNNQKKYKSIALESDNISWYKDNKNHLDYDALPIIKVIRETSYKFLLNQINILDKFYAKYKFIFHTKTYLKIKKNNSNNNSNDNSNNNSYRIDNKYNLIFKCIELHILCLLRGLYPKFFNEDYSCVIKKYREYIKLFKDLDQANIYQLDLKNAYGNVNNSVLLSMFNHPIKTYVKMFLNVPINFQIKNEETSYKSNRVLNFKRRNGIPLGCKLSYILFEIYISTILNTINTENIIDIKYVRLVDDFRIVSKEPLEQIKKVFRDNYLLVNEFKTKPLDLSEEFLGFPNNILNAKEIINNYHMYVDKYTIRSNRRIISQMVINLESAVRNTLDNYDSLVIGEANSEYIRQYLHKYWSSRKIYQSEPSKKITGIEIIYYKDSLFASLIEQTPNLINLFATKFVICNICFLVDNKTEIIECSSCYANYCKECVVGLLVSTANLNCISCSTKLRIDFLTWKNIITNIKIDFLEVLIEKKKHLTLLYNNLMLELKEYDTEVFSTIVEYMEGEVGIQIPYSSCSSDVLRNLITTYKKTLNEFLEFTKETVSNNDRYNVKVRCKYCLEINESYNKVFKCSSEFCNKLYQCKICPLEFTNAQVHECDSKRLCPSCRIPVEKISGCNHITCNCGKEFNYITPSLSLQVDFKDLNTINKIKLNDEFTVNDILFDKVIKIILEYNIDDYQSLLNFL